MLPPEDVVNATFGGWGGGTLELFHHIILEAIDNNIVTADLYMFSSSRLIHRMSTQRSCAPWDTSKLTSYNIAS